MEASESIQFWIISSDEPGRIEVPVDTSSDIIDIIRPVGDGLDADDRVHRMKHMKSDLFCESPVDVMDANHSRSISTCTVSTTTSARATLDELRLPDVGRLTAIYDEDWALNGSDSCPSGRSYDSMYSDTSAESQLDAYASIEEFDSAIKGSLSEIRVRRAYRGRQSLLREFDLGGGPRAPDEAGVDVKVFGFTFQNFGSVKRTPDESSALENVMPKFPGFGDLRRRISRFMSSKPGKRAVEPTLEVSQDTGDGTVPIKPHAARDDGAVVSNGPGGEDDFLVLIPGQS